MMKSCRTPSTLTEYSSVRPGRVNRTSLSFTDTMPVRGSICAPSPWQAIAPLGAACL